ncbi:hypothetical protein AB0A71_06740 [Kitasatospora aureofaciens]|uniref:hypothetical protein n=1 Tax=Kitasatospora aureofaciens TaxID=1894 RepID=UPI0033E85BD6
MPATVGGARAAVLNESDVQIDCAPGEADAVVGHVRGLGFEYLGEAGVPGRH